MRRLVTALGAMAALTCFAATVSADWSDNFDSYATDSSLHGQGGWKGWDNDPTFQAFARDEQRRSLENSVEIVHQGVGLISTDFVHEFAGYTTGDWLFEAWMYIPPFGFTGQSYFILLNTYVDGGPNNWSTQIRFEAEDGEVVSEFEETKLPIIAGSWVQLLVWIDLTHDTQTIFYDEVPLSSKSWSDGLSGGGAVNIGAVDLFANPDAGVQTSVYYDDLSLTSVGGGDCPWDCQDVPNGQVDINDLVAVINHWGACPGDPDPCPWDCQDVPNGQVDINDLVAVINHWGACPGGGIGPCCIYDYELETVECQDLTLGDCQLAGGLFYGPFWDCSTFTCPPIPENDVCYYAKPIEIGGDPIEDDTTGMTVNSYATGCENAQAIQSPALWYSIVGDGTQIEASLCNTGTGDWGSSVTVYCGWNCDQLFCAAGNTEACETPEGYLTYKAIWCSEEGRDYWIVVHGGNVAENYGEFVLTVNSVGACTMDPPECACNINCNGTQEGETCYEDWDGTNPVEDNFNGGCNDCNDPHLYSTAECGPIYCGTCSNWDTAADIDCDGSLDTDPDTGEILVYTLRDTDWWKIAVPDLGGGGANLTINFMTEFPGLLGVLEYDPDCVDPTFLTTLVTEGDCAADLLDVGYLAAGDYVVFVSSDNWPGVTCNDPESQYMFRVNCAVPPPLGGSR